jgi:WD40 repeat protein
MGRCVRQRALAYQRRGDKAYPLYLEYGNTVESLALSPDGKSVVAGNHDGVVKILDVATGEVVRTLRGYQGSVRHVAFSPDGKMILSTALAKDIGYISLWDAATGGEIKRLTDTSTLIYAAFSPDGK